MSESDFFKKAPILGSPRSISSFIIHSLLINGPTKALFNQYQSNSIFYDQFVLLVSVSIDAQIRNVLNCNFLSYKTMK